MDSNHLDTDIQQGVSDEPPESPIQEIIKAIIKNQLATEAKSNFYHSCRVLKLILENISNNPQDDKYRNIRIQNPSFNQHVAKYPSGLLILELLGFQQISSEEPLLIYSFETIDPLKDVITVIEKIFKHIEKPPEPIAPAVFVRPKPKKYASRPSEMDAQIKEYRSKQKNKDPVQGTVMTLAEIRSLDGDFHNATPRNQPIPTQFVPNRSETDFETRTYQVYNSISSFRDPRNLMLRAHELSNQYRASEGKLALVWHEGLCTIAFEHSKDMGDGKVPFGHQGFNKRYQRFPIFNVRGGAENVAYNNSLSDPGKVAVDGWINSPGHRKNLLGRFHYMAVGVYANAQGMFYFTQLFASI